MRHQPEDITSFDWSVPVLWASILLSTLIVLGAIGWQVGKRLKDNDYLKTYGIKTCKELRQPLNTGKADKERFHRQCVDMVDLHHDHCLDKTAPLRSSLRTHRHAYATCVFIQMQSVALDAKSK